MKSCILCGNSDAKLTAEHVVQASILKEILSMEGGLDDGLMSFKVGEVEKYLKNIKKSNLLKPVKNICGECNSDRSTRCDKEFHDLIVHCFKSLGSHNLDDLYFPSPEELKGYVVDEVNFSGFYRFKVADFEEACRAFGIQGLIPIMTEQKLARSDRKKIKVDGFDVDLIKKFLAKHAACTLNQQDVPVPEYLKRFFIDQVFDNRLSFDISLVSSKNDLGFSTSPIYFSEYVLMYMFSFKYVVVEVRLFNLE